MAKATVCGLIVSVREDIQQILLTKRAVDPFSKRWALPGGHIEERERAADAVIREVKEETGLAFTPHFFMYNDEIFPERNFHAVVVVFVGSATGAVKTSDGEVSEWRWFALSEALEMDLAFNHREIILSYALSKEEPSELELNGIITEFGALRDEMNTIFNTRIWGVATYLILVAGVAASSSKIGYSVGALFLIYAAIPFILHTATREISRIRLASYIREVLEKQHPGLKWETSVRRWRKVFYREDERRGYVTRFLHVVALSGINVVIPLIVFVGPLVSEDLSGMATKHHRWLYWGFGGLGVFLVILSFGWFLGVYARAGAYDKEFAQLRIDMLISSIRDGERARIAKRHLRKAVRGRAGGRRKKRPPAEQEGTVVSSNSTP